MRKNAFTMVEMVFVIIIFGIIATIGADILSTMYKNYLQSRTINYLQTQSEITLEQIAKRLQYRIKDTAIARNLVTGDVRVLNHSDVNENFNVVEWIGYSYEAQLTLPESGWTGFVDVDNPHTNSTIKTISTPGSNLTAAANIMSILTDGRVKLNNAHPAALIFRHKPAGYYDPQNDPGYGWIIGGNTIDSKFISKVVIKDKDVLEFTDGPPLKIYEHYYLAHTAYALVLEQNPQGNIADDFNLVLKYNYQPWVRDNDYTNAQGSALLASNVNLFRIKQVGNTIRIKLCLHDANRTGVGRHIVACKEEVIF